jgi:ubiquinone/menaquinone biosynthesis C-methylase UbiE
MKKSPGVERLETSARGDVIFEHLHRYALAMKVAKNKRILDVACGEGYGANLLSGEALAVTAVDIEEDIIIKARQKYKDPKIQFIAGSILQLPLPDKCFDLITCFETLEHVEDHELALKELRRVLKPDGLLIISTPEKANYSDKSGYNNPYHRKELYGTQFRELLKQHFRFTAFYRQNSFSASIMQLDDTNEISDIYTGNFTQISSLGPQDAMYWLAYAADQDFWIPGNSLFYDPINLTQKLAELEKALKRTITYRTGNFLLAPFKILLSVFRR